MSVAKLYRMAKIIFFLNGNVERIRAESDAGEAASRRRAGGEAAGRGAGGADPGGPLLTLPFA